MLLTLHLQIAARIKPEGAGSSSGPPPQVGTKRPLEDGANGASEIKRKMEPGMMMGGGPGGVTSEQVMVPDRMVGMIIGKGGEQITRLQAESGCKIQMAQESGGLPERMCTLTGAPQAIAQAKVMIDGIIAADGHGRGGGGGHGGGGGGGMGGGGMGGGGGQFEMIVPGQKVGLIIGKGGETIKQLQEQTGAKIIVIQVESSIQ